MMFVFLTKLDAWTSKLGKIQSILHLVSGKSSSVIFAIFTNDLHLIYFYIVIGCCCFLSSAANPFLYSLLSKRFRRGFHDIKQNILSNCRRLMYQSSSGFNNQSTRPEPRQVLSLPNNYPFRFTNKKVQSRNTIKRHFNQASSSLDKFKNQTQGLEFEMQDSAYEANHIVNGFASSSSGPVQPRIHPYIQRTDELKAHDGRRLSFKAKSNEHLKCKYKVMFKTDSNTDTILIVNSKKRKKQSCDPNIPRCPRIHDLRNIGTPRSVVHIIGTKNQRGYASYNSIADEKHMHNKMFSSSSSGPSSKDV